MKAKIMKKNAGFFIVIISIMLLTPTIAAIAYQNERQLNSFNHVFDDSQYTDTFEYTKIRNSPKAHKGIKAFI